MLSFEEMVDTAYMQLEQNNENKMLILPNIVTIITPLRMWWKNPKEFLITVKRRPEHFMHYLVVELPNIKINWASDSKSDGIVFHGKRLKQNIISDMVLKYVKSYVLCSGCKSDNTIMNRESGCKKYEFNCYNCGYKYYC